MENNKFEIKIKELKGIESIKLISILKSQLFGLFLTPKYASQTFEAFIKDVFLKDKESVIKDSITLIPLEDSDIKHILKFATDGNGIALNEHNIGNLGPAEIIDIVVKILLKVANINVF